MGEAVPVIRSMPGLVVAKPAGLHAVNCDGAELSPSWQSGYIPQAGDAVTVILIDGSATAWPVTRGARPGRGTVSGPASGGLLPVSTAAGVLRCMYTGTAPALNVEVFLDWQMTTPRVLAGTAVVVPPPVTPPPPTVPPPAPPPVVSTGVLEVPAIDSATHSGSGSWWNSEDGVRQGEWGGKSYQGAWFYGTQPAQARGLVVTRLRFRLGARRRMGGYNSPLELRFHLHGHATRPGSGPALSAGPHPVTIAPSYGGGDLIDLPVAWGQALVDNVGGIALSGGLYGGLAGRESDPNSGYLIFDWRTA